MAIDTNQDEERPLMVQELSSYELRASLREHVMVVLVCVMIALVSFVLPSETWWWWLVKGVISIPAIFVGVVRYFMLNGVRQELDRRTKASGLDTARVENDEETTPRSSLEE